jgi:hypothetical protein
MLSVIELTNHTGLGLPSKSVLFGIVVAVGVGIAVISVLAVVVFKKVARRREEINAMKHVEHVEEVEL